MCCRSFLTFIIILFISFASSAQEYIFNTRSLTTKDGLSNNQCQAIHQSKDGTIWIGTKYGLNRYDGHEFEWFTEEDGSIHNDIITDIVEDENGLLWLISAVEMYGSNSSIAIDIFDAKTKKAQIFEEVFPNAPFEKAEIKKIYSNDNNVLFIQMRKRNWYTYQAKTGFEPLPLKKDFKWSGSFDNETIWGILNQSLVQVNFKGNILQSLLLDKNEWDFRVIEDFENRIVFLSKNRVTADLVNLKLRYIKNGQIKEVRIPNLKIHGNDDLRLFRNSFRKSLVFTVENHTMCEIGSDLSVKKFGGSLTEKPYTKPIDGIVDTEGTIWIARRDGLSLYHYTSTMFRNYLADLEEQVQARGIFKSGSRIVVHARQGAHYINLKDGSFTKNNREEYRNQVPFPVYMTPNDDIWVGGRALYQLDTSGNIIQSKGQGIGRIWAFTKSKTGTWWASGSSKIYFYNEQKQVDFEMFRQFNGFDELENARAWHFFEDEKGIWVATEVGLFLIDEQKGVLAKFGKTQPEPHFLPANKFSYLKKDKNGDYWITTEDGGLIKMTFKDLSTQPIFKRKTRRGGLPSNELYSVYEDDFGKLWLSSSKGLVQMDKATMEVENIFFEEQGIPNNEFNKLSHFQDKDGRLYFGGLNGITSFHPEDFNGLPPYEAKLTFSSINILTDNKLRDVTTSVLENNKLVFRPSDKYVVLKFSLQDYFFSDKIKYQYQIKSVDVSPTLVDGNSIQLSNLPYGRHELIVEGISANKQISTSKIAIKFHVVAPFYLQWWFILVNILLLGVSIWQYNNWQLRKSRERQIYLEKIVNERTARIRSDKKTIEAQAEQLREMDEIKSRFFENVSHELRTPLTLILGPLQSVLSRNRLENRDFTLLMMMQQNGKKLLKLINELLDLSSLDANKMTVNEQPIELYYFARKIINSFEGAAQIKNIQLTFDFALDQYIQILSDEDKLEKILFNYLSNAIKFTPKNGQINLAFKKENNNLTISVSDTGVGILTEDLDKIFDRFYQTQQENKSGQGTGIGLALCMELAKLMKGKTWAESEIGKGSTFFVQIPMVEIFDSFVPKDKVEITEKEEETAFFPTIEVTDKPKLLVVEDNPNLLTFMKIVLEDYLVITAQNGQEALERLTVDGRWQTDQNDLPSLIISDVMMPVMDGIELLEKIKQQDHLRHIPIIMLTARQKMEDKLEALRIGVDDYMVKPFEEEELKARVANLIANSRSRMALNTPKSNDSAQSVPKITEVDVKWLEKVEAHILANIENPQMGIEQLAREFSISIRRLQQRIKSITGLTPKQYSRQIQLEYARRLLESGESKSVTEIANRIGFSDPHHFSTVYKKRYGRMPSSYF